MDIVRWRRQSGFLGLGKVLAKSRAISHYTRKASRLFRQIGWSIKCQQSRYQTVMPSTPAIVYYGMQFFSFNPISSTEHNSVVRTMVILDLRKDPSYCNKDLMEMEKEKEG